ncbi:DUF2513 domain-containing protein [Pseudomonas sp. HMWF006]|uniref:DUF2513 domain-containing protein n=1 Tax=Pseudomonas sp. HMWF006 TaxID=2056843 RepID=UPI000FFC1EB6|nr:DUF2513 domain-containing protein [Pseudomonas sp. HMWF006]
MKRDLVFSAGILSLLEGWMDPLGADHYDIVSHFLEDADPLEESEHAVLNENVSYHVDLLESADLIRRNSQSGDETMYYALTWAGHDYLDDSNR